MSKRRKNKKRRDPEQLAAEPTAGEAATAGEEPVEAAPEAEPPALDAIEVDTSADADVLLETSADDAVAADAVADDEVPEGDDVVNPTLTASQLPDPQLKHLIEALIFASDKPVTLQRIRQLTRVSDVPRLERLIAELGADYGERGIVLQQVSGGYQFRTSTPYSQWVQQLIAGRPVRLSRAQLETLAIVAYRQPITRPEIDEIRGVDSGATLKLLLDRALIRILGKKEEPGRPILYGTTREFLDFFSLGDLRELPTLREYSELSPESQEVMRKLGHDEPASGGEPSPAAGTPVEAAAAAAAGTDSETDSESETETDSETDLDAAADADIAALDAQADRDVDALDDAAAEAALDAELTAADHDPLLGDARGSIDVGPDEALEAEATVAADGSGAPIEDGSSGDDDSADTYS